MKTTCAAIIITVFCFLSETSSSYAQTQKPDDDIAESSYDIRLLRHYSSSELDSMRLQQPDKFAAIQYYLLSSYIIQYSSCNDCATLNSITDIDVTYYEPMREKSQRVTIDQSKQGFIIILLAGNELTYLTPLQRYRFGL